MVLEDWLFDQGPSVSAITLKSILDGSQPILHVCHDADDHGWQFLGWGDADPEDAAVIAMIEVVALDPSVNEVADLPPGWHAWREKKSSEWSRGPNQ